MNVLERLNASNKIKIHDVFEDNFSEYGKVLKGYNFSALTDYVDTYTQIPEKGNVYVTHVGDFEEEVISLAVQENIYGGLPIQVGYYNGKRTSAKSFEYNKGSMIIVAISDIVIGLGHINHIEKNVYNTDRAEYFYIPQGVAVEIYGTTLHTWPIKTNDEGFKTVIILPKGANTHLTADSKTVRAAARDRFAAGEPTDNELVLLQYKSKWLLCYSDAEKLIKEGAYPGLIGEQIEIKY